MKQVLTDNYDLILREALPLLDNFEKSSGGEGTAYFLSDKFVIKRHTSQFDWETFDEIFDLYCSEMKKFEELGYCVPKIYSWLKIPKESASIKNELNAGSYENISLPKFDYYILEERVKGRELFYCFLEDFYPECRDFCSKKQFQKIVNNPDGNLLEFNEISRRFFRDYILVNQYIESLPEDVLSKFVENTYQMYMKGKFSIPDVYPSNVLISRKKMNLIDSSALNRNRIGFNESFYTNGFISSVLSLFYTNESIFEPKKMILSSESGKEFSSEFAPLIKKNIRACRGAMLRLVAVMNKYCENPVLTDKEMYLKMAENISKFMPKSQVNEILSNINTNFSL
jgi:hypothetical protein